MFNHLQQLGTVLGNKILSLDDRPNIVLNLEWCAWASSKRESRTDGNLFGHCVWSVPTRTAIGVAKVGCARNDKTECGTGNKAFLIHSGFDLQSSRRSALRCSVLTLRGGAANPQSALGSGIPEESSLQRLHHDTTPAPTAL
ncbi:hypothetical protein GEV33_006210 [Tenebrio molitor]|uniref:Uncharacterized protein n=1 Tax=Tenebrio molitor TaxID=7067 RepID=A0A8J6HM93_TENMO|nr:hypothetical protein GEV33_006210 [Tenebrio molitor]